MNDFPVASQEFGDKPLDEKVQLQETGSEDNCVKCIRLKTVPAFQSVAVARCGGALDIVLDIFLVENIFFCKIMSAFLRTFGTFDNLTYL